MSSNVSFPNFVFIAIKNFVLIFYYRFWKAYPFSFFFISTCFSAVVPSLRSEVAVRPANLISPRKSDIRVFARKGSDPFRGKSGSVSFRGLNHQSVEESKLVSAPFKEGTGSLLWALAPVALISALVVPQFFVASAVEDAFKNEVFAGIL